MADDHRRPFRANETYNRPAASNAPAGSDPLAELARLIGQTDPFSEFGNDGRRAAAQPAQAPAQNYNDQYGVQGVQAAHDPRQFEAQQYRQPTAAPQQYGAQHFDTQPGAYDARYDDPALDQHQPASYDARAYYQDAAHAAHDADDIYDDVPPARRRISVLAIAGVFALAVVGTAGAFGYRAMFGSSGSSPPPVIKADTAPSKIVPSTSGEPQSNKLIYDRVGDRGPGEKLVSREEQPIDINKVPPSAFPNAPNTTGTSNAAAPNGAMAAVGSPTSIGEPKRIRTVAIRPDQNGAPEVVAPSSRSAPLASPSRQAPRATAEAEDNRPTPVRQIPIRQAAPEANAPLSLNPNADPSAATSRAAPSRAAPARVASAPARPAPVASSAGGGGGYLVQVSSQRSEADAQSSFRALQGKYPGQLGNRQAVIRRADLGDKGTYYRAMVGPFADAGQANEVCSSLKSAGGSCIVQKN
jgi:hypothetical protein